MSEITMPAELMAAVNIFGGAADMTAVGSADGSQGGSFGSILGLLMADSGQVNVPAQEIPEIAETEASVQPTLADILLAAAMGDENAELPEVFTEKGALAFFRTLASVNDGELSDEAFEALWGGVSTEEKAAFAELLDGLTELSGDKLSDMEEKPDVLKAACGLILKAVRKQDKKASEKDSSVDDVIFIPRADMRLFNVETVTAVRNEAAFADNNSDSELKAAALVNDGGETATIPVISEKADGGEPTADTAVTLTAESEKLFAALDEADTEETAEFLKELSQRLNVSVKEALSSGREGENITFSESAPVSQNVAPEAEHIDFGRQNLQGFLARVNRASVSEEDIPTEAVIPQNTYAGELSESIPADDSSEISSQILRQIDLYRDIFSDSFSEKEINMKLSPDELGGLEIKIRRSDKGFEITFTAERAEAAELISRKTSELAEAMASRGIALKEISVSRQIVTSEADGTLSGNSFTSGGGLYGGAQGENGSDRHFSENRGYSSDGSSEQQDDPADTIYNREAKLWVSA